MPSTPRSSPWQLFPRPTSLSTSVICISKTQYLIILSTCIVCAMSFLLLVLFWKVLSYQRKLDQAARFQLAQLERAALIDNLTTLGNHRAYQEQVPRALDQARQQDETLALALIDV